MRADWKYISLCIVFFCSFLRGESLLAQNQIKSFTEDPVKFIEELKSFYDAGSQDKKQSDRFVEAFEKYWKTARFNVDQTQSCYKICNLMLKKRLKPDPYFTSYLTCLMNFVDSRQSQSNFTAWNHCLEQIIEGKAIKKFSDYLSMSESLFYSNSFFKSPTYEWGTNKGDYIFEFRDEPVVVFKNFNLSCYNSKSDSSTINNTEGVYYPFSEQFIGKKGRMDWGRVGLDANAVYADIVNSYTVTCKAGGFTIDSVIFYHKQYFQKPLMGTITEKVISQEISVASYPRFDSYNKRLQINGLAPNIDYDGGFSMRGAKFIGSGTVEEPAYMRFKRNDKYFIIAGSKTFVVSKDKLTSENASIMMFLDADTVFHPGLNLNYIIKDNRLSLFRSEEGLSKTPYFNSFHELDMYFEELNWKMDEPKLDLKMMVGSTQGEADFESSDYYKLDRYERMQGMSMIHPFILIRDYMKANGNVREFSVVDLAKFMKVTADQLRPVVAKLSNSGMLAYNAEDDRILVKDRLLNYITNRAGKSDYDVISFHSAIPGTANASINLLNNDMTVRGVESILLSDSQKVFIFPSKGEVVLKKNRDFTFAGVVKAGRFEFFGKEFSFEYDKFKLNLTNVDSLRIKVEGFETNSNGEHPLVRVKTVIENITGDLLIDNPTNRSGVKSFPKYPVFNSFKESYVFYDKKSKQKSVYNRDKFYFKLEPFTIDSLDNFDNASLRFQGDFVSAGIFPTFKEALTLQQDYSLGFIRSTPPGGFALYGGKATFENTIKMSNQGLQGDGDIKFVTSLTKSNDIIFYPDSLNANAQSHEIAEVKEGKVQFPQVKGENVYVHYMPYKEIMQIHSKEKPFDTYNGKATFSGRYDLTPQLLSGDGKCTFSTAELESNNIAFKNMYFDADTADFRVQAKELNALAFTTSNVNAHVDFKERNGLFKSNGRGTVVNFPVNQYMCYMDNFKWYMDKSDIEIGSSKSHKEGADVELTGSEFISLHPKQDSLRFVAPFANYDIKNYIITCKDVKYIDVADARIFPDSGKVVIRKNAVLETFKSARVLANTITKFHNLFEATIDIFGRKSYSGSGYYDYVDELKIKQHLYFSSISVDTTFQTYASTEITDSMHFTLSPNYDYRGKVTLQATNKFLTFDGACKIHHACEQLPKSWFTFTSEINPDQIYIPVSKEPVSDKRDRLAASIMLANDSIHVYSAFLSEIHKKSDIEILPADGFLFFDKPSQEYRISNKEKLVERNLPGNYISMNTKSCTVYGEGKINYGIDLGQVKLKTVGNVKNFLITDSTLFETMMGVDFFFDDNAIGKMADEIGIYFTNLSLTDFSRPGYEKGLRELLGKEEADKLISQVNLYGSFKKFPDELKCAIFFNDLNMKWDSRTRSYLSSGKLGIGNINKTQVNKYVDGRLQIVKKRGGDILNIYMELDGSNWYFFSYSRGLMQAISSNESFNNIIKELKTDKRQMKTEKGQAAYQFGLSTLRKKDEFVKKTGGESESEEE